MEPASFTLAFDETSGVLTVTGELDEVSSAVLREVVQKHSGDYAESIVVDLSAVEYLPSVAIGVLAKARQTAEARGRSVDLVAADGTIAQRVLQICALPHRTA